MTDPQIGMLMLGLFIFIIMLGFPIAFTLVAMGGAGPVHATALAHDLGIQDRKSVV